MGREWSDGESSRNACDLIQCEKTSTRKANVLKAKKAEQAGPWCKVGCEDWKRD